MKLTSKNLLTCSSLPSRAKALVQQVGVTPLKIDFDVGPFGRSNLSFTVLGKFVHCFVSWLCSFLGSGAGKTTEPFGLLRVPFAFLPLA